MRCGKTGMRSMMLNLLQPFSPVQGQQACLSTCARNGSDPLSSEPPQKPIGFLAGNPSDPFRGNVPLSFLGLDEQTKVYRAVSLITWQDVVRNGIFRSHFPPDPLAHVEDSASSLSEAQFPAPVSKDSEPVDQPVEALRAEKQDSAFVARRRRWHAVEQACFFRPRPAISTQGASRVHCRVAQQQQRQEQQQQHPWSQPELPLDPASTAVTREMWPGLRERHRVRRGGDLQGGTEPESSPSSSSGSNSVESQASSLPGFSSNSSSSSSDRTPILRGEHSSGSHGSRRGPGSHTALHSYDSQGQSVQESGCDSVGQSAQEKGCGSAGQSERGSGYDSMGPSGAECPLRQSEQWSGCASIGGCDPMGQREQRGPWQSEGLRGRWGERGGVTSSSGESGSCHSCHDETTSFPSGLRQHLSSERGWVVEDGEESSSSCSNSNVIEASTDVDDEDAEDDVVDGEVRDDAVAELASSEVDGQLDLGVELFKCLLNEHMASKQQEKPSPPARTASGGLVFGFWSKAPLG